MPLIVAVFLAGGAGALTLSVVNAAIMRRYRGTFELGTFIINVTGATLLGLVTGFTVARAGLGAADFAAIFGTRFLGAYTTFSTEAWQTLGLLRSRRSFAALNVFGAVVVSLAGAAVGLWLGTQLG